MFCDKIAPDTISESRFPIGSLIFNQLPILESSLVQILLDFRILSPNKHVVPQNWYLFEVALHVFFSASQLWTLTYGVFLWSGLK